MVDKQRMTRRELRELERAKDPTASRSSEVPFWNQPDYGAAAAAQSTAGYSAGGGGASGGAESTDAAGNTTAGSTYGGYDTAGGNPGGAQSGGYYDSGTYASSTGSLPPLSRKLRRMAEQQFNLNVVSDDMLDKAAERPETMPVEIIPNTAAIRVEEYLRKAGDSLREANRRTSPADSTADSYTPRPAAEAVPGEVAVAPPTYPREQGSQGSVRERDTRERDTRERAIRDREMRDYDSDRQPFWTTAGESFFNNSSSYSITATSALVISTPDRPTEMITETGEVYHTNTVGLPKLLGETGGYEGVLETPETLEDDSLVSPPSASASPLAPVSASRAVSAGKTSVQMFAEPKKEGFWKVGVIIALASTALVGVGLFAWVISQNGS